MKKICFLGDSIRLGYAPRAIELLGEDYDCFSPGDNCRFARYTLRCVYDWRRELAGSDVIHWNNGLWDACDLWGEGPFTSAGEYVATMLEVAHRLLPMTKTLVFATTTPVRPDAATDRNPIIDDFNARLVPRLREMGVVINDLHAVIAQNVPAYIKDSDKIHLTEEGIEAAAHAVADTVRRLA